MLLKVKISRYSNKEPVQIPLWQIKILKPVEDCEGLYQFKIGDNWQWYYVDEDVADEISNAIQETERRMIHELGRA